MRILQKEITEGKTKFSVPDISKYKRSPSDYSPKSAPIFYNPLMEFNRDMSVAVLSLHQKMVGTELLVVEPLAASGIRGIRYANEVPGLRLVLNDINPQACEMMKENVKLNKLSNVDVRNEDASRLLNSYDETRVDVVDLDPFGSPVPFADPALRAVRRKGGLLCATATDMTALCGVYPRVALRHYGARTLHSPFCKEVGLRVLLGYFIREAAEHDFLLNPVFSYCADHYVRAYFMTEKGTSKVDKALDSIGFVMYCPSCMSHSVSRFPEEKCKCGKNNLIGGPLWLGGYFNQDFVRTLKAHVVNLELGTRVRCVSMLDSMLGEVEAPFYYQLPKLNEHMSCEPKSMLSVMDSLRGLGYPASRTHFDATAVKTSAPADVLMGIMHK